MYVVASLVRCTLDLDVCGASAYERIYIANDLDVPGILEFIITFEAHVQSDLSSGL